MKSFHLFILTTGILTLFSSQASSFPGLTAEEEPMPDSWLQRTHQDSGFTGFLKRINSVPEPQRQAIADSFLLAAGTLPFIEADSLACFLYRSTAATVTIAGDANNWDPSATPMTRISGTTLFYARQVYENDARLDYKFVVNNSNWVLDPKNPNLCYGGYGPNSELRMPAYPTAAECAPSPGLAEGRFEMQSIRSDLLKNTRALRVYLPAGYDTSREKGYPVVLFHDGLEYISLAGAKTILDNLIGWNRIEPLIAVFVPPVTASARIEEYSGATAALFERFIIEEVMTHVDSSWHTSRAPAERAMLGPSLAALISAQICLHHPEAFGLCGLYSPALWPNARGVLNEILAAAKPFQKCYIDAGTYEPSLRSDAARLHQHLQGSATEVKYRSWHEGHSWGSWRAHLDESLEFFFPRLSGVERVGSGPPRDCHLYPAYPNPFNAVLTIEFTLPREAEVALRLFNAKGQEVGRLVQERLQPGHYIRRWNAAGEPSGLYCYQLDVNKRISTGKALLIR